MLWYKSWLDTRWRFFVALGLLTMSAAGIVLTYPRVLALLPLVPASDAGGELGRRIREAAMLAREFRGYIWSQWFHGNARQEWTIVAALLGTGGLVAQGSRGALFTLSLPVSRNRLLAVRAAAGLGEMLVVALAAALLLPLLSPTVGERYALVDALAHAICLFAAGAVFFSLALLLSTSFEDPWRPLLIALATAAVLAMCEMVFRAMEPYSVFTVMSGDVYFRTGRLPWLGIAASLGAAAAMFSLATVNLARRDF
jgi:ABC-2 type transport system permease protein